MTVQLDDHRPKNGLGMNQNEKRVSLQSRNLVTMLTPFG